MLAYLNIKKNSVTDELLKANLPKEAFHYNYTFNRYMFESVYLYGVAELIKPTHPKITRKMLRSLSYKADRLAADENKSVMRHTTQIADTEYPAPHGLSYYPFQNEAIAYSRSRHTVLLGDEMGLGKTVSAIGIANDMKAKSICIICKKVGIPVWQEHIKTWLINKDTPVTIVNYEQLNSHLIKDWDLLIVDEAHSISNYNIVMRTGSKRAQLTFDIARHCQKRIFLSGTFMKNSAVDIYPFLEAFDNENWEEKAKFKRRYCRKENSVNKFMWKMSGGNHLIELQHRLRKSIMLRREKSEVISLPKKTRQIVTLSTSGEVKEILAHQADQLGQITGVKNDATCEISFDKMANVRKQLGIAKVPAVVEYIDTLLKTEDKIVVFAHHVKVVEKIAEYYGNLAVTYYGGNNNNAQSVIEFKTNPKVRIFIGNMVSAGTTITLTNASTVVFAELSWVPDAHLQSEDRCHRIGQTHEVKIHYLIFDDPLDKKLLEVVTSKEEAFRFVMGTTLMKKSYAMMFNTKELR